MENLWVCILLRHSLVENKGALQRFKINGATAWGFDKADLAVCIDMRLFVAISQFDRLLTSWTDLNL